MPHHKAAAAFLLLFFAALTHPVVAQDASPSKCQPEWSAVECNVRRLTDDYFAALKFKDWSTLSRVALATREADTLPMPGKNLSLRLLQQLLGPLKIETLEYTVIDLSISPDDAKVRYVMRLRVSDPRSGKTVINIAGAQRELEWMNAICDCPQTNMRTWLFKRDAFDSENLVRAYRKARNDTERKFILIGPEKSTFEETVSALQQRGIDLIDSEEYTEAFKVLSQAQKIHNEMDAQARVSSQLDLEEKEQLIAQANASGNVPVLAGLMRNAGATYLEIKETQKARSYLETSLALFQKMNDVLSVAEVHAELAEMELDAGDYLGGATSLQRSMEQYLAFAAEKGSLDTSKAGDLAEVMGELFLIYQLQGRVNDADRIVQEAQKVLPDSYKALFIFARGVFQLLRGQVPQKFDEYERAIDLLRALPRTQGGDVESAIAGISLFLGVAYSMQGNYTKAAFNIRRTKEVMLNWKLNDPEMAELGDLPELFVKIIEGAFYGTGSTEAVLESRLKNLIPRIPQGADLSQLQIPSSELDVPHVLQLTSLQFLRDEKYEQARQCLLQALALAPSSDDKTLPALLHLQLAAAYQALNNDDEVFRELHTSLRLSEEMRGPVYAVAIGWVFEGINLLMLASKYESAKNYAEARKNYQRVLELLGPFTLLNFAIHKSIAETYYDEGKYGEAIKELEKGIALARKMGMRSFLWEMYQLSGVAHWANNEPDLSRRDLEAAVTEIEAMRDTVVGGEIVLQHFFEDKLSPYHDLIEVLLQQGDCDGAFAYAERSKSRVLLDVLKRGRRYAKKIMSPSEQIEEASLRRKLIALNRQVENETYREPGGGRLDALRGARAEARLDYELFRANLYVAHPELATASTQESIKVEGLQNLLTSPDVALLEYVETGHSTYLFVLTAETNESVGSSSTPAFKAKCRAYPLKISGDELADKVNDFRLRVGHPESVLGRQAQELYNLLLKPAESEFTGKKTLVIVPDGILWEVPFQALKPKADRYLLQDSVIYYAPSFTVLQEMKQERNLRATASIGSLPSGNGKHADQRQEDLRLLIVGNPLFPAGHDSLQGTGELATRLENLYGKTNTRVYTEATAAEERITNEASNYQVIHLGTHSFLDDDDPMYSYVMFSRGEEGPTEALSEDEVLDLSQDMGKDGFLEAWEIMDLELNAQLVVLSACETARGRVGNGEGIVGLSWSLFIAGAPSTVVSQWNVEEKSTNELMFFFHENFVRRGQTPQAGDSLAEALQKASLKLMESPDYRHPYYWAGFVVMGDGSL